MNFIHRAKKISNDGYIEGWYFREIDDDASEDRLGFVWVDLIRAKYGDHYQDIEIDPDTLEISFDGGEFKSIEEISLLMNNLHEYLEQSGYIFNKG